MGFPDWVVQNWFDASQTLAIIVSLSMILHTVRTERKVRLLANSFELTKQHRELWTYFSSKPALARIFDEKRKSKNPSRIETEFITLLILHLKLAHRAMRDRLYDAPPGLAEDIRLFFSKPVPRQIWDQRKQHYDLDFVAFVEEAVNKAQSRRSETL